MALHWGWDVDASLILAKQETELRSIFAKATHFSTPEDAGGPTSRMELKIDGGIYEDEIRH
jgi:hypothetical protein